MDATTIVYVVLPMLAGAGMVPLSYVAWRLDRRSVQLTATVGVAVLVGVAGLVLGSMLRGAYPTYLPHLALVFALAIVLAQLAVARARERRETPGGRAAARPANASAS